MSQGQPSIQRPEEELGLFERFWVAIFGSNQESEDLPR
eukprot:s7378_g1.t1